MWFPLTVYVVSALSGWYLTLLPQMAVGPRASMFFWVTTGVALVALFIASAIGRLRAAVLLALLPVLAGATAWVR